MERKIKKITNIEEMLCSEYQELKEKNIELQSELDAVIDILNKIVKDFYLFYEILFRLDIEEKQSEYNGNTYYVVNNSYIYDGELKSLIDKFMEWKKDFEKATHLCEVAITDEKEQ